MAQNEKGKASFFKPIYLHHPCLTGDEPDAWKNWEILVFKLLQTAGYKELERRIAPDKKIDIEGFDNDKKSVFFQCKYKSKYGDKLDSSDILPDCEYLMNEVEESSIRFTYYVCSNVTSTGSQKDKIRSRIGGRFKLRFLEKDYWTNLLLQPMAAHIRKYHFNDLPVEHEEVLLTIFLFKIDRYQPIQVKLNYTVDKVLRLLNEIISLPYQIEGLQLVYDGKELGRTQKIGDIMKPGNIPWKLKIKGTKGNNDFLYSQDSISEDNLYTEIGDLYSITTCKEFHCKEDIHD